MIVFDLKCSSGHVFEGWFASGDDYEAQQAKGLLLCPMCDDASVTKAVMAPAVPAKSNQRTEIPRQSDGSHQDMSTASDDRAGVAAAQLSGVQPSSPETEVNHAQMLQLMQVMAKAQAETLKNSEWVGNNFAEKARAMHYGEVDHQSIHGEVDKKEARDLLEEGVNVAPLLFPVAPPKSRN